MREHSHLSTLMEAYTEYKEVLKGIEESKILITEEDDHDMKEMAREELKSLEERLPTLESNLKMLLIPPDPLEEKNIIMEIRGGTGGDESSLFAADLFRRITIPAEISFIKLASYEGTTSTGVVKEVIGLSENLAGRTVVIVEDIIDTGCTMQKLIESLNACAPESIHVCTLLLKPDKLKVNLDVEYVAMEIPNDFIVGYGLDYDGYGRNLKNIYTVVE